MIYTVFLNILKRSITFLSFLSIFFISKHSFAQDKSLFEVGRTLNYLGTESYDETPLEVKLTLVFTSKTTCYMNYSLWIDGSEKDRFNDTLRLLNTFAPEYIFTLNGDSIIANVYSSKAGTYLKLQQDFIVEEVESDNSKENKHISELAQIKLPKNRNNIVNNMPVLYLQKEKAKRKKCFLKRK